MTEPKSTDRSALVGRLREALQPFADEAAHIAEMDGYSGFHTPDDMNVDEAVERPGTPLTVGDLRRAAEAAALIESPPAGEIQGRWHAIATEKPEPDDGNHGPLGPSEGVRTEPLASSSGDFSIAGLVERLRYESITGRVAPITASLLLEAAETITRLSQPSEKAKP